MDTMISEARKSNCEYKLFRKNENILQDGRLQIKNPPTFFFIPAHWLARIYL
jgi:hypothetical protein